MRPPRNTARATRAGRAPTPAGTVLLLNKPFGVLCRFTTDGSGRPTLAQYVHTPGVYPAGRLDADSEGLVVLTDDGALQARIAARPEGFAKVYWVQVEGIPGAEALERLRQGVALGDFVSAPCGARRIDEPPGLWPRTPPIRFRRAIPTAWLELTLNEGRNRQVRRMTAAVGLPALRLVRWAVGPWTLAGLPPGAVRSAGAPGRVVSSRPIA